MSLSHPFTPFTRIRLCGEGVQFSVGNARQVLCLL